MDHFYQNIDGFFHCEPLYRRMVAEARDGDVFVQVGVWRGRAAAFMGVEILNSGKRVTLRAVDAFTTTPDGSGPVNADRLREVRAALAPLHGVVTVVPSLSVPASARFADGSLAFAFVDADHSYRAVKADILAWLPKVRPGGMLAGDDYRWPGYDGLRAAVDETLPGVWTPDRFEDHVSGWWEYRKPGL